MYMWEFQPGSAAGQQSAPAVPPNAPSDPQTAPSQWPDPTVSTQAPAPQQKVQNTVGNAQKDKGKAKKFDPLDWQ